MESQPWMKMYFLLNMEIFQPVMLVFGAFWYYESSNKLGKYGETNTWNGMETHGRADRSQECRRYSDLGIRPETQVGEPFLLDAYCK